MVDTSMIEQGTKPSFPPQNRITEARSLLSQVVETRMLPIERLKAQPKGEVVDLKKIGETLAVLEKVDDHYEVAVFDGKGVMTEIMLDPTSHDIGGLKGGLNGYIQTGVGGSYGLDFAQVLRENNAGFSEASAEQMREAWLSKANKAFKGDSNNDYNKCVERGVILKNPAFTLPAGEWKMSVILVKLSGETEYKPTFGFFLGEGKDDKAYCLYPNEREKKPLNSQRNVNEFSVGDSLALTRESTIFRIADEKGKELVSYSGTESVVDPSSPNDLYFIQTGQVYKLDLAGVANRTSKPVLEQQIKVEGPRKILFEPNGNFLIIPSDKGLLVLDKETGDVVESFDDAKGQALVDEQGDIVYVDGSGKIREVQTNFQAIPKGGSEQAARMKEEALKKTQERFANLELKKVARQKEGQISENDVANTLRDAISKQVSDVITKTTKVEDVEDVLDRLQGLKGDPANKDYQEVIDEFVSQARDRLSGIRSGEFDGQLNEFGKTLDGIKSVGDTIGLDEQFSKLLELRQKIDITNPQKRREIEQRIRELQTRKDGLNNQYQGELVDAVQKALPELEQLIKETGSSQELVYFSTSQQAQQFEMMMVNIKDPQVRKELRDRYSIARAEQRARLEEQSRQLGEQDRQRWAQIVGEAREDLNSLRLQIEELSDSREIDRFGKNPLITAWRAKLFGLPPELREMEEKRLEIILGAKKKDMDHRKNLGAVGEAGELKFGDATFPVYKEPPRLWQPKLVARKTGFSQWADLVFEDSEGKVWKPAEHDVVVNADFSDHGTQKMIEQYRKEADEYFKGIKRKVPDFDEHWRITATHMEKLAEVAETLNLQLVNHRGILILQGEAGTGKNVLVDMLANLSNREVVQIACNENTVKEDLTYEFYYDPEKGTYKLPSRLIQGIKKPGTIILFDEINALKPGIAKMMNSLFDYHRRIFIPEGGKESEIITDPTVLFVATMNPQNYAGVNRLSPEVKSRSRVIDLDYPPFEESRGGRTYYRSDEAEMLAAYMDGLGELKQGEFKQVWDYVINRDTTNGADVLLKGNPQAEQDVRRVYDVIRVANRLRDNYAAYQRGDSNEPMDFPTSLREVTDIVMEMNHRQGTKKIIKRVILPKIDDRRQKRLVEQTIDAVLPDT